MLDNMSVKGMVKTKMIALRLAASAPGPCASGVHEA